MKNTITKSLAVAVLGAVAIFSVEESPSISTEVRLSAPAPAYVSPVTLATVAPTITTPEQITPLPSRVAATAPLPSALYINTVNPETGEPTVATETTTTITSSKTEETDGKMDGDVSSDKVVAAVEGKLPPSGHAAPPLHTDPALLAQINEANSGGSVTAMAVNVLKTPRGLTPSLVRTAYGTSKLANQGEGQIIAIVDAYDNPTIEADLGVFSTQYGLPACTTANGCFTKIYASGVKPGVDPGWALEIALDIQWAHAVAPKAKILLVEARSSSFTDLMAAIAIAVQKGAGTISLSWGGGEFNGQTFYDAKFNVKNVSFFVSSGDSGSQTNFPAASPYVVSVGGTSLVSSSIGTYTSESAWTGSGGGISLYEPQPQGQTMWPLARAGKRGIPDVSYNSDPNKGYSVYTSTPYMNTIGWFSIGGTSAAAPQWAALAAIANSMRASVGKAKLNALYNTLYTVNKGVYGTVSNDVTTGQNGSCGAICTATGGYDYVTGLGTPRADKLIPALVAQPQ